MKAAVMASVEAPSVAAAPVVGSAAAARPRLADYLELTKPRIAVMALFTVAVGFLLGAAPGVSGAELVHTLIGAALVAGGSSALNQWLERRSDARMARTANRPLPAGRMHPVDVVVFGLSLSVVGLGYLLLTLPHPAAAVAAAVTLFTYVAVYTPLKPVTALNTLVGAVPGALPPVIGWCAASGSLGGGALALFAILFVWQLPHFFAIAWMYRDDYADGGLRMLPAVDPTGRLTGRCMILTCALLIPVSLGPVLAGITGTVFLVGAVPLGLWFLAAAVRFDRRRTDWNARRVLRASLVYLTGLMGLLIIDGVVPRF
jgi:heme o synthase